MPYNPAPFRPDEIGQNIIKQDLYKANENFTLLEPLYTNLAPNLSTINSWINSAPTINDLINNTALLVRRTSDYTNIPLGHIYLLTTSSPTIALTSTMTQGVYNILLTFPSPTDFVWTFNNNTTTLTIPATIRVQGHINLYNNTAYIHTFTRPVDSLAITEEKYVIATTLPDTLNPIGTFTVSNGTVLMIERIG